MDNDMCLFQWGTYDWGTGEHFEVDFTRQFSLNDLDGNYDHMEQLSLTLLFDAEDPELRALGAGDIWSGDDLDQWEDTVRVHPVMQTVAGKRSVSHRLEHSDV